MVNKITLETTIKEFLNTPGNIEIITSRDNIRAHVENILNIAGDLVIGEVLTRFKGYYKYYNNFRHIVFPIILSDEHSFKVLETILPETAEKIVPESKYENHSVNIKPANLLHKDFYKQIINFYNKIDSPSNIIFELTEYTLGKEETKNEIIIGLKYLKQLGFKLAIDDIFFLLDDSLEEGSIGLENLYILLENKIIPDYVKIDGGKLESLYINRDNPKFQLLIQRYKKEIIKIKQFGCIMIGERIKNIEDANFAEDLGCDLFQGQDLNPADLKQVVKKPLLKYKKTTS